jgi:hypothetical protein
MSDAQYIDDSAGGAMGLASASPPYAAIGAPGVKVTQRAGPNQGKPYSTTLETMTPEERTAEAKSIAAIKTQGWGQVTDEQRREAEDINKSAYSGDGGQQSVGRNAVKAAIAEEWTNAGFPPAAVQAAVQNGETESGLNPFAVGDGGTSFSIYQHHGERAQKLAQYFQANGASAKDPVQVARLASRFAISEFNGGDPIATAARDKLMNMKDPREAYNLFRSSFERPGTLRSFFTSGNPALDARGRALEAEADRLRDEQHAATQELLRQANEAPAGSKERDDVIAELRRKEDSYRTQYEAISAHPPILKPVDAMEQFGSTGFIMSMLIGLFARRHMTAALNAGGAAMKAINDNNWKQFETQYKTWEHQSATALEMVKLHADEIRELIADKKMSIDEKNTRIEMAFRAQGNDRAADMMALGEHDKVFAEQANIVARTQNMAQQRGMFMEQTFNMLHAKYLPELGEPEATVRAGRESGWLPAGASGKPGTEVEFIQNALKVAENKKGSALTDQEKQTAEAQAHSDWGKASAIGRAEAGYDLSQKIYGDETIGMVADSYIAGNDRAMVGMARQNVGAYAMARVWKAIADKLAVQEIKEFKDVYGREPTESEKRVLEEDRGRRLALSQAEFQGIKAGERTAFTRAASLVTAAAEAKQFTPQALETSRRVSRTDYPDLNRIEMAVKERTGNKDVVDFYVANLSLADAYAQVIGRGNTAMTDAARAQATSMLNRYWSEGQYETAVSRINKEIDAAQKAPEEVIRRFREGFLQRETAAPAAPVGAVGAQKEINTQKGLPTIIDQSAYSNLPSGSHYLGPDGLERVKP